MILVGVGDFVCGTRDVFGKYCGEDTTWSLLMKMEETKNEGRICILKIQTERVKKRREEKG